MKILTRICLLAGIALQACLPLLATAAPVVRDSVKLERDWRFQLGEAPSEVVSPTFSDATWQQVTLPHTWNQIGAYSLERPATANNTQGVGWYRLKFSVPAAMRGKRVFLEFDGVGAVADVWLNGKEMGRHEGAFSRFRFDVSEALLQGQPNLLVVKADNSKPAPGSATEHVLPMAGDFFIHGGLYRAVSLIATDAVHIDLLDHGGPGVYISTPTIEQGNASVQVLSRLRNEDARARTVNATVTLLDAKGKAVATASQPVQLAAQGQAAVTTMLEIVRPMLWNGRAQPYLYQAVVELRDGSRVMDRVTQRFGVRNMKLDANRGFVLNGNKLSLYGVSRHQDVMGEGWAISKQDQVRDMALIKEMGANTLRLAHYQHAQEIMDLSDEQGVVVWAEIPLVSQSAFDYGQPSTAFIANAHQQLIELIRQNFNHPSIVVWSVGNEVDLMAGVRGKHNQGLELLKELNVLAHQEDSTRATTFADCCEDTPGFANVPDAEPLAGVADSIGYNRYFGWYYGQPDDIGAALDALHRKHPTLPMSLSEYGAGGALTQHTINPMAGPINATGRPHPEEFQSYLHEHNWKQIRERDYLWGVWIWNMFDFASDARQEGDATDINDKGLVSYDRRVKKDAFYFYKANWSDAPVLHLNSRRYIDRPYAISDVTAYSNAEKARLYVNSKDLGEVSCPDRICIWRNVLLRSGDNQLRASARVGTTAVKDAITWRYAGDTRELRIAAGTLAAVRGDEQGGELYGPDNFFDGGEAHPLNTPPRWGSKVEVKKIQGPDATILQSYREGEFSYRVPLPNAEYDVSLLFFEPKEAGQRTFSVMANGQPVLQNLDIAATAGGALREVRKELRVTVTTGELQLHFKPESGPALISAIHIRPVNK